MSYLGAVEAVLARLQGKPKAFVPPLPKSPSHYVTGSAAVDGQLRASGSVNIAQIEVPIFFIDDSGSDVDQVPNFTFRIISITPRYSEYVYQSESYKGDYAYEPVAHSKSTVTDTNGETVGTGAMLTRERKVMHPFDFLLELRANSDDEVLASLMTHYIYSEVFEPRDFLRVPMRDGSYRSWDLLFKDFQDMDRQKATRDGSPGIERLYSKVWTYQIEGYLDNTDTAELVNVVRSRRLTVTQTGE